MTYTKITEICWGIICVMFVDLPGCLVGICTSRALILVGRTEITQKDCPGNYLGDYTQTFHSTNGFKNMCVMVDGFGGYGGAGHESYPRESHPPFPTS